jgi:SAM-dependent methyltransferase
VDHVLLHKIIPGESPTLISKTVTVVPPPRRSVAGFAGWVAESCSEGMRVLDIGAGRSRSGALRPITRQKPYLVGVDPDVSINDNVVMDECFHMSLEEFAPDHAEQFDVAFAVYVLEHVADPGAFVSACARVLKPGGELFGLTLNMHQYFGLMTWATSRLGLSEKLLAKLKTPEVIDSYHFRTEYRLNSIRSLTRRLDEAGFRSVEFRCYDDTRRYAWYLPERLHWFARGYTRAAYVVGSAELMGHLSFRARI